MKLRTMRSLGGACTVLLLVSPALAGWPGDPAKCKKDAVKVGPVCMDTYEASVWEIPAVKMNGASNKGLINKVQKGTATLADLANGEAIQRGVSSDDYPASCPDNAQGCDNIYALSLAGVMPSAYVTWFQAQAACSNSRKRLPRSSEWQMAVQGTQDPGPDNGSTDCKTLGSAAATGSRSSCVSAWGAYDMVGNLQEWVAEWVPRSTTSGTWSGSGDGQVLAGAATTGEPGALLRGGAAGGGNTGGPLTVTGYWWPSLSLFANGFRCAR